MVATRLGNGASWRTCWPGGRCPNGTEAHPDADTLPALPQEFRGYCLHLDFREAQFITASGLGRLVSWHLRLQAQGGQLILMHVGEQVYEIFEVSQLTRILDVRPAAGAELTLAT